jgi:Uri superfamily endonuclease
VVTDDPQFPIEKGTYALLFSMPSTCRLKVGRLGLFDFRAGMLVYLGSALGSGGLGARLRHHWRSAAAPHWHADYLQPAARLAGACWTITDRRLECVWSRRLASLPGAFIPVPGFGSSDCRNDCPAHLVGFDYELNLSNLAKALQCEWQVPFA